MNTILFATDFSSAARNAALYGFELARLMRAKVILFTAYQPPLALPDSPLYVSSEELEKNSYKMLMEEAEAVDPNRRVPLETQSRQGPVNTSILEVAQEKDVTYIVVGMKDRGKEVRRYFGSTVTHLAKTSGIPVIVVPATTSFTPPTTIALASDIASETDLHILDPLKKIAEKFTSSVAVVRVIKNSMDEVEEKNEQPGKVEALLAGVDHRFEFIKATNVAKALTSFVAEQQVNMVAVMPREHSLFERLFTKSVTKELVFNSPVPLLILPGNYSTGTEEVDDELENSDYLYNIH